jgi:trans-aconitate methyltransferase
MGIGCGAGHAVAELAEREIHAVGVDPDPWMLAAARERWPAAEFWEAGRRTCRSPTEVFAAIVPTRSSASFRSRGLHERRHRP